jgi:hypothetical protein
MQLDSLLKQNRGSPFYFTNESVTRFMSGSVPLPVTEYAKKPEKVPPLTKLVVLQVVNPDENRSILLEFFGSGARVFGWFEAKTGFENKYKELGLKVIFGSHPGLALSETEWSLYALFIEPTLQDLANYGALHLLLGASQPSVLCPIPRKMPEGFNVYEPDYYTLLMEG